MWNNSGVNALNVLGIDIGSDHCGLACLYLQEKQLVKSECVSIISKGSHRLFARQPIQPSIKMRVMGEQILQYVNTWTPDVIVIEQPFVNSLFPHVAIRLYRLFYHLFDILSVHCPHIEKYAITAPKARKLLMYNKSLGVTTKDAVKCSIKNVPELVNIVHNLDELDEHALDAIVCSYAYCKINILETTNV